MTLTLSVLAAPVNELAEENKNAISSDPLAIVILDLLRKYEDSRKYGMTTREVTDEVKLHPADTIRTLGVLRSYGFVVCVPRGHHVHANITTVAGRDLLTPFEPALDSLPHDWFKRLKASARMVQPS